MSLPLTPAGTRTVTADAQPSDDRSPVAQCEATLTRCQEAIRQDRRRILAELERNTRDGAKISAALAGLGVEE